MDKENTACAEPLATVEVDVALILLLRKLYFLWESKIHLSHYIRNDRLG